MWELHFVSIFWTLTSVVASYTFGEEGKGEGQFDCIQQIACDSRGNVYTADYSDHRIQIFSAEGKFLMIGGYGKGSEELNKPWGVAVDSSGRVYISEHDRHCVSVFNAE